MCGLSSRSLIHPGKKRDGFPAGRDFATADERSARSIRSLSAMRRYRMVGSSLALILHSSHSLGQDWSHYLRSGCRVHKTERLYARLTHHRSQAQSLTFPLLRLFSMSSWIINVVCSLLDVSYEHHAALQHVFYPAACSDECGEHFPGMGRRIH